MITRKQWRAFIDSPVVEWSMFGAGVLLDRQRTDHRAAARAGRDFPHCARRWMDWALRRPSASRREVIRKADLTPGELPEGGLGN